MKQRIEQYIMNKLPIETMITHLFQQYIKSIQMQMQHVFYMHTQQGMELHPRCCTGTVMTLVTRRIFQCKK
jgi:hypothetical protein